MLKTAFFLGNMYLMNELHTFVATKLTKSCLLFDVCIFIQADCTPATCTQMTATEQWIFLCAAHKTPREV